MSNQTNNQTSREQRVYNLTVELAQAKQDKKDTVAAHNDNVKRIQMEIAEILAEAGEVVT
jgi:hypothetical protein